jgi:hypothetical protein
MELRNGDRNALSKPLALRGGSTVALEVVVVRRDGFEGEIELGAEGLPAGVTVHGLRIGAGQTRGMLLVSAAEDAPRGLASPYFFGRATINGSVVTRPLHLASMAWPVPDAWSEIPSPRLLADVPVSVSGSELAPLTIASAENKVWEVASGEKLTVPLRLTRRSEFSGTTVQLRTLGCGFEQASPFEIQLTSDQAHAELDLARTKTPPGDYLIAFYGGAVAQYRYDPLAVIAAEQAHQSAQQQAAEAAAELQRLNGLAESAAAEKQAELQAARAALTERQQRLAAAVEVAAKRLQEASARARPNDIVDIVVSQPVLVRVRPVEKP